MTTGRLNFGNNELFKTEPRGSAIAIVKFNWRAPEGPSVVVIPQKINGKLVVELGPNAFLSVRTAALYFIPKEIQKIHRKTFQSNAKLCVFQGSYAHLWALRHKITHEFIGESDAQKSDRDDAEFVFPYPAPKSRRAWYKTDGEFFPSQLVVPDDKSHISDPIFWGWRRLKSFDVSPKNESYSSNDGNLFSKDQEVILRATEKDQEEKYTLQNGVLEVGKRAFFGTAYQSVVLSEDVEIIGSEAFSMCCFLTEIELKKNVREIGEDAFSGCQNLEAFRVDPENPIYSSFDGALYVYGATLARYPSGKKGETFNVPEFVDSIGERAFSGVNNLKRVYISENVSTIEYRAFSGGGKLEEFIVAPENAFFSTCDGVLMNADGSTLIQYPSSKKGETYAIPEDVERVEDSAFAQAAYVKTVIVHEGVREIGEFAFEACPNLEAIEVSPDNFAYSSIDGVLFNQYETELIQYPSGSRRFQYETPEGTQRLLDYSFSFARHLRKVVVSESVMEIEENAFTNSGALGEIEVSPDNERYSSRDGVLFNADQTELIFYPNQKFDVRYTVPATVKEIKSEAFRDAAFLRELVLQEGVESIGSNAFWGCRRLFQVVIPKSVSFIGSDAFLFAAPFIYLYPGSYAEEWALENDLPYVLLVDNSSPAPNKSKR